MNTPPLLVVFPGLESLGAALARDTHRIYWSDVERLVERGLPPAVSVRVVACLFGFSARLVGAIQRSPERYYRIFKIPKGKSSRQIEAPRVALKVIQKWFGSHLAAACPLDDCVYGFVPGRSAPLAAKQHCGASWVYSLDIRDFFPSVSSGMVSEALRLKGYPDHAASLMAKLCCYEGRLAQGSPASPALSNLVFAPVDQLLAEIARANACTYTRYADDITFSGRTEVPARLQEEVRKALQEGGWQIAGHKEHLARAPRRLKVHGLLVNGRFPRLTKGYRNRLRALEHLLGQGRLDEAKEMEVRGHLAYARSVESLQKSSDGG
ncbi:MAG: RNA-directed DNA polymerase [Acidobacteria bacterium]|nr:RNA-directed DNA polymerase [Acidobacteriota bacterium]